MDDNLSQEVTNNATLANREASCSSAQAFNYDPYPDACHGASSSVICAPGLMKDHR